MLLLMIGPGGQESVTGWLALANRRCRHLATEPTMMAIQKTFQAIGSHAAQ